MTTIIWNGGAWTVMVGDVDISDAVTGITINHAADVIETTHFGGDRTMVCGLRDSTVTLELVCKPTITGNRIQLLAAADVPTRRVTKRVPPNLPERLIQVKE